MISRFNSFLFDRDVVDELFNLRRRRKAEGGEDVQITFTYPSSGEPSSPRLALFHFQNPGRKSNQASAAAA